MPDIRCTGIAEDLSIRQPELIFLARTTRTRGQVEAALDRTEHHGSWAVAAERDAVEAALDAAAPRDAFTPVAVASLLLYGRLAWGDDALAGAFRRFAPEA